jgi:hypothetical protein
MGAQAVVVEVEVLERNVGGKEGNEGRLGVQAEGVVVKVDGVELGEVEDRGEEGGKSFGDLVKESAGEDIGEVCDLGEGVLVKSRPEWRAVDLL